MKIVYTYSARQDLKDIYEYIAFTLLVSDIARDMISRITSDIHSLESLPEKNLLYKEEPWHSKGIRFLPVKKYLVFYQINEIADTVSIVRIIYGGRDITHQLEELDNL